jgi:hypothetical protein
LGPRDRDRQAVGPPRAALQAQCGPSGVGAPRSLDAAGAHLAVVAITSRLRHARLARSSPGTAMRSAHPCGRAPGGGSLLRSPGATALRTAACALCRGVAAQQLFVALRHAAPPATPRGAPGTRSTVTWSVLSVADDVTYSVGV